MTWSAATQYCHSSGFGALASIHSRQDVELVTAACFEGTRAATGCWVGLQTSSMSGAFQWNDNTHVDYMNWAAGEPSSVGAGTAASIDRRGQWHARADDVGSENLYRPVCKASSPTSPPTPPPAPMPPAPAPWPPAPTPAPMPAGECSRDNQCHLPCPQGLPNKCISGRCTCEQTPTPAPMPPAPAPWPPAPTPAPMPPTPAPWPPAPTPAPMPAGECSRDSQCHLPCPQGLPNKCISGRCTCEQTSTASSTPAPVQKASTQACLSCVDMGWYYGENGLCRSDFSSFPMDGFAVCHDYGRGRAVECCNSNTLMGGH